MLKKSDFNCRRAREDVALARSAVRQYLLTGPGRVICCPNNAPGMGRVKLFELVVLVYGLVLRFWVVIAIIVSLTLTITVITTLTIILP